MQDVAGRWAIDGIVVSALREPACLSALAAEWWRLWRRSASATPFQSPAWLLPWISEFAGAEAFVLAARRGAELVGLLPLVRRTIDGHDWLLPCGAGASDYLDGLFAPGIEGRVADALLEAAGALAGAARLALFHLCPSSPLCERPPPHGWREERCEGEPCPILALPAQMEHLPASLPKRMVQNVKYYRARAERAGRLRFERAADGDAMTAFEQLLGFHRARWADPSRPSLLADPAVRRFQHAAIPSLAAAGLLRLYRLSIAGRPAAIHYGLRARERAYYYNGGFDPEFSALGVGTLMTAHAIEDAVYEGCRSFDFLIGREPYKYLWGAKDQPTHVRTFLRSGGRQRADGAAEA